MEENQWVRRPNVKHGLERRFNSPNGHRLD
jgi:hypothetical protein